MTAVNASAVEKYKDIAIQIRRDEDPTEVAAREEVAGILSLEGVNQFYITIDSTHGEDIHDVKASGFCKLYDELQMAQVILYCRNQELTDKLKPMLTKKLKNITVVSIDVSMTDREQDKTRLSFQNGYGNVMIINDEIQNHRGLEFACFERQTIVVINFDLPVKVAQYSKRVGRRIINTSRKGVSIILVAPNELEKLEETKEFYKVNIKDLNTNALSWKELRYFLQFCI